MATEQSSVREPYGISQVYAAAFGVFFIVLGAIGLARANGFNSLTSHRVEVMQMTATPLLSLIHLGIGVLALASAVSRGASRAMSTFLGAGLVALGIIALIEGVSQLGWSDANGIAYIIAGALGIVGAALTPSYAVAKRRTSMAQDEAA